MNFADIFVSLIVIGILALSVYFLRRQKKNSNCNSCVGDCSTCNAFSNFYEDYKKDEEMKKKSDEA